MVLNSDLLLISDVSNPWFRFRFHRMTIESVPHPFYRYPIFLLSQYPIFISVEWQCSFPGHNLIIIPSANFNFIAKSWSGILFYPNPEHELEFHPNQGLFYPIPGILILSTCPYPKWILTFYPETASAPQPICHPYPQPLLWEGIRFLRSIIMIFMS